VTHTEIITGKARSFQGTPKLFSFKLKNLESELIMQKLITAILLATVALVAAAI
jgi:hypothetical protein